MCRHALHVKNLNFKKIDKNKQSLLEIRMKAVKEQTKLQKSSRDKVKSHSETQTLEKAVSLMVAM